MKTKIIPIGNYGTVVNVPGPFTLVSDIRKRHTGHWFDVDSRKFFKSRIGDTVYFGRFFISSEKFNKGCTRIYTIRLATDDGNIKTVEVLKDYTSSRQALSALKKFINQWE
jgi:hypothetical protein